MPSALPIAIATRPRATLCLLSFKNSGSTTRARQLRLDARALGLQAAHAGMAELGLLDPLRNSSAACGALVVFCTNVDCSQYGRGRAGSRTGVCPAGGSGRARPPGEVTVLVPLRRRRATCSAAPGGAVDILIHHLWCLSRLGFKLPHEFTVYLSAGTEGLGTWSRIARYGACLPLPSVSSREGGG